MSAGNKLDKFDLAILTALQQDARISLHELSAKVGLTSSPCWARIKRMEDDGVIEGYTVKVNAAKVGAGRYRHRAGDAGRPFRPGAV